ncbi:MAG: hypothetical protein JST44_18205 [Cyanobacteria bacterium SZAS LIN-5]|nr:hypothetical protein [Cyanobacteria bacterium SZAS LIN-5]
MKRNSLSNLIFTALMLSTSLSMGLGPATINPASAQQQLVAMADPSAMVVLCFRMSPRTTDQDKQFVVNYLMQQGLYNVGFRPNGYECTGQGTCADAMRIMKSQLYVAQLTLSNQMILAYRFDPLPQNPLPLNNKARFASVADATGFTTGAMGGSSTGFGSGTGTGMGYGGQQSGNQQGGYQQGGAYQYGSGQGELGNGMIGGSQNQMGSQYGSQYGTQSSSPYGSTTGYTGSGGGAGSKPIWNKENGTLSPTGQGIPELYGNNTTGGNSNANGLGSMSTGNYANNGSTNYGNTGTVGSGPIWNKTNGTLSPTGQGIPELYGNSTTGNGAGNGLGNLSTGQFGNSNGGGLAGSSNSSSTPAYNPNAPAYNPNAPAYNPNAPANNPNAPAYNPNNGLSDPNVAGPLQ